MEKIRTFIQPHCGELDNEVYTILKAHPEWWGELDIEDFLHTNYYDVLSEKGELLGFFGNAIWNHAGKEECVVCCVYVKEEYRKQGIFKKMIKYTTEHNFRSTIITIGAMKDNKLAQKVYSKMFRYSHENEDGLWYIIKDRRK